MKKIERIIKLDVELMAVIHEIESEQERVTWLLSIAANALHDVPNDVREEFFNNFNKLKEEVIEVCGS